MTAQVVFSLSTLVLCAVFFVYVHVYIRRRTSRESILTAYREEVNRLVAEIDHATDRDTRLVEERITALRKTLEEADRRIALMSRDMEKRRAATELYTALGSRRAGSAGVPGIRSAPVQDSPSSPFPAASANAEGSAPGEQTANAQIPAGQTASGPVPAVSGGQAVPALGQRVAELSRQGFAAEIIAARLGLSFAEVELALAVSRRTGT
ncbi:MAG: hypothetical protein LBP20_11280 [Treponema sp.]|nr:hypothetical protein [Treponema sp.]